MDQQPADLLRQVEALGARHGAYDDIKCGGLGYSFRFRGLWNLVLDPTTRLKALAFDARQLLERNRARDITVRITPF